MLQTIAPTPLPDAAAVLDDFELDIFGQQGTPVYTQISLIYALPDASPQWYLSIVETLQTGLVRLSASFPWIAGQIIVEHPEGHPEHGSTNHAHPHGHGNSQNQEHVDHTSTGVYKIKYLDDIPKLVVKDLRGDTTAPTMQKLREAKFPFRLLDESVVAPRKTLILPSPDPLNVCLVQATFIDGGLIFTFLGHHAVMDGVGQGEMMNLLQKACRNEQFTPEELDIGNAPRKNIIPLFPEDHQLGTELNHQLFSSQPGPPPPPPPATANGKHKTPHFNWEYYVFSGPNLKALKDEASNSLASGYISTDDALTAFVWQAVVRARLPRLRPSDRVTLARAVNVRSYLKIAETYPGNATNMSFHDSIAIHLISHELAAVATNLRASLDPKTSKLRNLTKAYATYLHRTPDKNSINLTATLDLSKDIMLSSWAKLNSYDLDFGFGIGKPEAVRRPQFTGVESLMYLMPRKPDGEIAVALCLREDDLDRLNSDEEFLRYGTCVI
ncbi:hypothetical protein TWF694_002726 [Orbilia ellipsospora]|uniref:Trichothecene 3-O-acetyltransferase-like N-terminal domain-containing protein n=1 Tax=Orbilia ellipsospora TaxID=2528407 RepID=A0AAV9X327_9PEZI